MAIIVIYAFLLIIYWISPKYIKIVAFILNMLVPDPIPFVDEFIMILGLFAKRKK